MTETSKTHNQHTISSCLIKRLMFGKTVTGAFVRLHAGVPPIPRSLVGSFQQAAHPEASQGPQEFHGGHRGRTKGPGHRRHGGLPEDHQGQSTHQDPWPNHFFGRKNTGFSLVFKYILRVSEKHGTLKRCFGNLSYFFVYVFGGYQNDQQFSPTLSFGMFWSQNLGLKMPKWSLPPTEVQFGFVSFGIRKNCLEQLAVRFLGGGPW